MLEILAGIRREAPNLHISIKLNSDDFTFGGIDENEALEICKILDNAEIDSIEISANSTSRPKIKAGADEGYFVPFAARTASEISAPIIVVGGFRSLEAMQNALENSKIQFISLSCPLIREPNLPIKLQSGRVSAAMCILCNGCYSSFAHKDKASGLGSMSPQGVARC